MGRFAETANLDYRLSFVDQEKQTFIPTNFIFSINTYILKLQHILINKYIYIYVSTYIIISIYISKYISICICYRSKRKTGNRSRGDIPKSVHRLLIVQMEVFVRPFFYDETNGSYPFANGPNRPDKLVHLWK
jgi:hypothetical protein